MEKDWNKEIESFKRKHLFPGNDGSANRLNLIRVKTLQEGIQKEFHMMVDKLSDGEVISFEEFSRVGTELWIIRAIRKELEAKVQV